MIYGLNFGAPDMPDEWKRRFQRRIRRPGADGKLETYVRVGMTDEARETAWMTMQADEDHRKMIWLNKTCRLKGITKRIWALYVH